MFESNSIHYNTSLDFFGADFRTFISLQQCLVKSMHSDRVADFLLGLISVADFSSPITFSENSNNPA